jgi:putative permease
MNLRSVSIYAAVIFGTLLLVFLAWVFRDGLVIFGFSLAVAASARPMVSWLLQRGISRSLAVVIVYTVAFALLAAILMVLSRSLLNELQRAVDGLARSYDQLWREWPEGSEVQQLIVQRLPAPADLYQNFSIDQANSPLQPVLNFTIGGFSLLGQFAAVLILSIYWIIDQVHFERLWLSLLPVESRARSRDIWRDLERDFGAYIRSEVLQSMLAGALLGLGYWLMGLPFPTLLALFGALAWLIPWLGGVLAVLPAVLVGLPVSLGLGIGAGVYAIAVLIFLEFYIGPRFTRRRQFSSLLSILLILALVEPFGLLGFIVAPPLAAAIELIFRYSLQMRSAPAATNETGQQITELHARLDSIHEIISKREEAPQPQVTSLLTRLEDLLQRANQVVEDR